MTDDTVYLQQVRLTNFRSFGPDFHLTLPPRPGLTVLVGANGLGKSNFFDGMEWALTGGAERLDLVNGASKKQKRKALRRIGVTGSARVHLGFTDGIEVTRTESQPFEFQRALLASGWEDLPNPEAYLAFTHLLGQSARQRFVNRDARQRFSLIETLTGRLAETWNARRKLGRPKFGQALDQAEAEARQAGLTARNGLQQVKSLQLRRATLMQMSQAERARSPDEVLAAVAAMALDLRALGVDWSAATEPEQALAALGDALIRCQEQQAARLNRLDQADTLADDIRAARSAVEEASQRVVQAGGRLQAIPSERATRTQQLATMDDVAQRAAAAAAAARQRLSGLRTLRDHRHGLDQAETAHRAAERIVTEAATRSAAATAGRNQAALDLTRAELATQTYGVALSRRRTVERLVGRLNELQTAEKARTAANEKWQAVQPTHAAATARLTDIEGELRALGEQEQHASYDLVQAKAKADAMSQAVASIAALLTDPDTKCPVCGIYHRPPQLKERADASARTADQAVSAAEDRLAALQRQRAILTSEQISLSQRVEGLGKLRAEHEQAAEVLRRLEDELAHEPDLVGAPSERWKRCLDDRLQEATTEVERASAKVLAAGTLAQRTTEKEAAERQFQQAAAQETEARQTLGTARSKRDSLVDTVSALVALLELGNDWSQVLEEHLATAAAAEQDVSAESEAAAAECHTARSRIAALEALADKMTQEKIAAEALEAERRGQMGVLMERWSALAIGDEVSLVNAERAKVKVRELRSRLGSLEARRQDLLKGFHAWANAKDLHGVTESLETLRRERGVETDKDLLGCLEADEAEAGRAERRVQALREQVTRVVYAIDHGSEAIRTHALLPLNGAWQAFNTALLSSQDYAASLSCTFGEATAQAEVIARGRGGEINPELYMSEGQIAALNIGLLLSASVTYPWSRWRAVLLDDPLQHNDSIHASSFMDVIRNLILYRHYQIVLSSHDVDEASYFLRKCANAGIPTRVCHLLARGDSGVVWEADG